MDFRSVIARMEEWFHKNLTGDQYEALRDRIHWIPVEALSDIVDTIIDENPPTPGKFPTPARIKEGWRAWKSQNPNKVQGPARTDCTPCQGEGFLWYRKTDPVTEMEVEFVARCAACENWLRDMNHNTPVPLAHRSQLEAQGLVVLPIHYPNQSYQSPTKPPSVAEVAKNLAEEKAAPSMADFLAMEIRRQELKNQADKLLEDNL